MEDHFRFATAYWHTFCGTGGDPLPGTKDFPWNRAGDAVQRGSRQDGCCFEFMTKIGTPFYCFHATTWLKRDEPQRIRKAPLEDVDYAKQKQKASGVKLLWGTANVVLEPRFMNGASTNPTSTLFAGLLRK